MTAPATDMPIIVLAAGQSSRMGGLDKLMQIVDGVPLIRRQVDLARGATAGPVIVALPPPPHPRYHALNGTGAQRLPVPDAAEGMNASLRTAIAAVPQGTPAAMVLLGDLPDLTLQDLNAALRAVDLNSDTLIWRGATETGKPGHPVVFSARLFDRIAKLTGDGGGREIVASAQGRVKLIPLPGNRARLDLDTPQDWADWRAAQATSNS
ncbi:nucleotidyltransferase family protein [Sedimentitalea nanhaiensis]|uniref:CTP:molybdopterin cytidylyltransferase MocA n=1 Tax=Sedimentitalea nanhaiensis TaxID=999627 RepID=A0A1I7D6N5_9RHOB|nr:nucleotidyltransferase family protein [Sedimentitalea nanhaiensis]SFU07327.1 CTP:molybdopterin cytidylyltransferase MocA [Sedimentitalea nanhaiensis]